MEKSDLGAILEIVPQISYEIVGRIIPGVVIVLCLLAAAVGPARIVRVLDQTIIHPDPAPSGWAVVLILVAAYVLAFALDGLWQIPKCLRRRRENGCPPDPHVRLASFKFDVVNQKLPKAGAWLTKLYAETNAAQVLALGWAIGAAINAYRLVVAFSVDRLWLEVMLAAGTIGAVAARDSITATREESLDNLWLLLQEETPAGQTGTAAGEGPPP